MPEGNDAKGEEVRPVPPGQEDRAVVKGMEQAEEALAKEGQGRMDKELKALERVHAKYARKAERAATRAGDDAKALRDELKQLQGQEVSTEEQARAVRRRAQELAEKHRPSQAAVLEEAGIDRDALAKEILASVPVPEHARAVGRRGKDQGGKDQGTDSLGWTTEED